MENLYNDLMISVFLDFFFPRQSLSGEEGSNITTSELQSIIVNPIIFDRAALYMELPAVDYIVAATSYDRNPLLRAAIKRWKYKRMQSYTELFTRLLLHAWKQIPADRTNTVLCPIPLHWSRRFSRGYNQAALLSNALSERLQLPTRQLLQRKKSTGFQSHRNREERIHALQHIFCCRSGISMPKHVILIDDVLTTGSTLQSCAQTLKDAGVARVYGLTIAQG